MDCSKLREFSHSTEVWIRNALAQHVRQQAVAAGYASLAGAAKATVQRILAALPLHPEKVTYYLERRDPDFEAKMREVLLVCQDVALQNQTGGGLLPIAATVSVDENPGLEATADTSPDVPPVPGKYPTVGRDHEYRRLGTCSILAALDLHKGHVNRTIRTATPESGGHRLTLRTWIATIHRSARSECTIRLVLDNHAGRLSKEAQAFLATQPNQFQYVLTPKHGSWLNIVGTPFGRMPRIFLRRIRMQSWEELRHPALNGVDDINSAPVVHLWKKFEELASG